MNVSPEDPRFLQYLNDAQERLVKNGEPFWGSHQRVQFCVTSGCIVLPRQIASVELVAICDHPIPVRNQFFEFLEIGIGLQSDGSCGNKCGSQQLLDRGTTCSFADIIGQNKKLKIYTDLTEDADAFITLFGYDDSNQWIRTQVDGEWIDGVQISLSGGPITSTQFFSALTGAQKPITNGPVRIYEYDTDLATQRALAIYEPSETNPAYRKMFISGLDGNSCCGCTGDDSETTQVTVMAKLEFIPAMVDSDWLLISNLSALKLAVMAIMKEENNLIGEADAYMNGGELQDGTRVLGARGILRAELRHYLGRGAVTPMRMQPRNLAGAGVRNII